MDRKLWSQNTEISLALGLVLLITIPYTIKTRNTLGLLLLVFGIPEKLLYVFKPS